MARAESCSRTGAPQDPLLSLSLPPAEPHQLSVCSSGVGPATLLSWTPRQILRCSLDSHPARGVQGGGLASTKACRQVAMWLKCQWSDQGLLGVTGLNQLEDVL